ncbi:MAG: galactokinase [Victivallaceae bacterium]|nr:galactokinase [Victivallaceae bacterium]
MTEIIHTFQQFFQRRPAVIAQAPGRLEILGNHTDYNQGLVLSCAVEQHTSVAAAPAADRNTCRIKDYRDDSEASFALDQLDHPNPGEWVNYLKGVIWELNQRGISVDAVDVVLNSTVPLSAGMSSSAALEVGFGFALKELFDIDLDKTEWAKVGQGVENRYLGVSTGLLDQFSSIYGARDALIMSDFRINQVVKTVKLPPGYVFIVANSMEKHDLVDSEYNVRRRDCESAAAKLRAADGSIRALRDVSMARLEADKGLLTRREYLHARHIVGEGERVLKGVAYLEQGDIEAFGQLLFESHESSRVNFENSTRRLDYLVELAKSIPGCLGARLSGGGFGGITIHLVEAGQAELYGRRLAAAFKLQTGDEPQIIKCAIGGGATAKKIKSIMQKPDTRRK